MINNTIEQAVAQVVTALNSLDKQSRMNTDLNYYPNNSEPSRPPQGTKPFVNNDQHPQFEEDNDMIRNPIGSDAIENFK